MESYLEREARLAIRRAQSGEVVTDDGTVIWSPADEISQDLIDLDNEVRKDRSK